jgi:hypothetical protein
MNDERREARIIGTQMTQILRIYADFDSEQSTLSGLAKPEGLDFHNRGSETCGSDLSNNCLNQRSSIEGRKSRANLHFVNLHFSPVFDCVEVAFQAVTGWMFCSAGLRPAVMKIKPFGLNSE